MIRRREDGILKKQKKKLFFFAVSKHLREKSLEDSSLTSHDWKYLSKLIPGRTTDQCEYKWSMARKHKTKKEEWTEQENRALYNIVSNAADKRNWRTISHELNKLTIGKYIRKPKQCRERWLHYLNPDINRLEWTDAEDLSLFKLFMSTGRKWANMTEVLHGRTESSIKNRFNCLVKKEKALVQEEQKQYSKGSNNSISLNENNNFSSVLGSLTNKTQIAGDDSIPESLLINRLLTKLSKTCDLNCPLDSTPVKLAPRLASPVTSTPSQELASPSNNPTILLPNPKNYYPIIMSNNLQSTSPYGFSYIFPYQPTCFFTPMPLQPQANWLSLLQYGNMRDSCMTNTTYKQNHPSQ